MKPNPGMTRRTALALKGAVLASAALPGAAGATLATGAAGATGANGVQTGGAGWHTATADDLEPMIGQRFTLRSRHGDLAMKLVSVERGNSGPARPSGLPRCEGVVAVFESPDMAPLVCDGHCTYTIRHRRLGSMALFAGPVPKRGGGHVLEMVLN